MKAGYIRPGATRWTGAQVDLGVNGAVASAGVLPSAPTGRPAPFPRGAGGGNSSIPFGPLGSDRP